jgi:hypothetical protein
MLLRFLLAALLVVASIFSFVVLRKHDRTARAESPPPSLRLVRELAQGARVSSSLTHRTPSGTWRFVFGRHQGLSCWVLVTPSGQHDGTCVSLRMLAKRRVLTSALTTPREQIAYGVVSRAVRRLRVTFSDCSRTIVGLARRPLFWVFASRVPVAVAARLETGGTATIPLGAGADCP